MITTTENPDLYRCIELHSEVIPEITFIPLMQLMVDFVLLIFVKSSKFSTTENVLKSLLDDS
jgi:hypothetical protein